MQAITDLDLENWHDYEVDARREIVALLRQIGDSKQLVRMLVRGESDVCVTAILKVDPDGAGVILDRSIDPAQNQRILAAGRVFFETSLDKIRIVFAADGVQATEFEGAPALLVAVPASMIRLQRREFYRMTTPVSNPVRVLIPMEDAPGGSHSFPLGDISCGGIAILDNALVLGNTIGQTYPDCRIELPEGGPVTINLQIRNSLDLTMLNSKRNRRLGCAFVNLTGAGMAHVQRYITRLERERNARLAGLR